MVLPVIATARAISNIVEPETKTWWEGFEDVLIHLHNYTADRYRWGGVYYIVVGWVWGFVE